MQEKMLDLVFGEYLQTYMRYAIMSLSPRLCHMKTVLLRLCLFTMFVLQPRGGDYVWKLREIPWSVLRQQQPHPPVVCILSFHWILSTHCPLASCQPQARGQIWAVWARFENLVIVAIIEILLWVHYRYFFRSLGDIHFGWCCHHDRRQQDVCRHRSCTLRS